MMRAKVIFSNSCVRSADFSKTKQDFLTVFILRAMWLARKEEQETSYHHAEILDAFETHAGQLFNSTIGWAGIASRDPYDLDHSSY
jgi:hypothetical protein